MSENNRETRSQRNRQKRGQNQTLKLAIGLVAAVLAIFLFEFLFGSNDGNRNEDQAFNQTTENGSSMIVRNSESETSSSAVSSVSEASESSSASQESESEESESEEESEETREVASNDPNVIRAVEGNWAPIGTTQSEPHVTNYNDGSADRIEIKRAVSQATGVPEGDMIENWVGNNGEQKVTATITQPSTGKIYRAYLSWVAQQGWQVTRIEELRQVVR